MIESGLQPGDTVVVEGLQRVRPGVRVQAVRVELEEDGSVPSDAGTQEEQAPREDGESH